MTIAVFSSLFSVGGPMFNVQRSTFALTPALTPALSPGEREKRAQALGEIRPADRGPHGAAKSRWQQPLTWPRTARGRRMIPHSSPRYVFTVVVARGNWARRLRRFRVAQSL